MTAKSDKDRQREFRERRAETHKQVSSLWISRDADGAWERLAKHYGLSKVAFLERLLVETDQTITEGMDDLPFTTYIMGGK